MLSDVLDIPADLEGKVPCQDPATRGLFQTLDLDIDYDDPDYLALSVGEKQARYTAKAVAEEAAVSACSLCPIINECREWASRVRVHGVAGGLTEKQRYGKAEVGDVSAMRGARKAVSPDLVEAFTNDGLSSEEIAGILDCSSRTVVRVRSRHNLSASSAHSLENHREVDGEIKPKMPRGMASPPKGAKTALDFDSLSAESLAMFDMLAEQTAPVDRKMVVQHIARFVTPETALQWAKNLSCDEEKKKKQGALKFARNRIDIAYRNGRVIRTHEGKSTLLSLPTNIKREYRQWRNSQAACSA